MREVFPAARLFHKKSGGARFSRRSATIGWIRRCAGRQQASKAIGTRGIETANNAGLPD
jgi:hypothetical protein